VTDKFSRSCAVTALILLAIIALRPGASQVTVQPQRSSSSYPLARNPVFKVVETEQDAKQINDILTRYGDEGAFQLATAPIIKSGEPGKVILILVQHW
jgi:hypothetical protein